MAHPPVLPIAPAAQRPLRSQPLRRHAPRHPRASGRRRRHDVRTHPPTPPPPPPPTTRPARSAQNGPAPRAGLQSGRSHPRVRQPPPRTPGRRPQHRQLVDSAPAPRRPHVLHLAAIWYRARFGQGRTSGRLRGPDRPRHRTEPVACGDPSPSLEASSNNEPQHHKGTRSQPRTGAHLRSSSTIEWCTVEARAA